jgi:hypothetical protein
MYASFQGDVMHARARACRHSTGRLIKLSEDIWGEDDPQQAHIMWADITQAPDGTSVYAYAPTYMPYPECTSVYAYTHTYMPYPECTSVYAYTHTYMPYPECTCVYAYMRTYMPYPDGTCMYVLHVSMHGACVCEYTYVRYGQ